jgi:hypothetical protein
VSTARSGRSRRAAGTSGVRGSKGDDLDRVGLRVGEQVRFRRRDGARWTPAIAERLERDGSVGLRDPKGSAVAIPVDRIEVRAEGPRGGVGWEPLAERLARSHQLRLL